MQVETLLQEKGLKAHFLPTTATLEQAIDEMSLRKVGALVVIEGEELVGILTEKDVLRCYLQNRNTDFSDIKIKSAMNDRLIIAQAEEHVSAAMAMMIEAGIRHLPVIKKRSLIGMLTISDLMEHQIGTLTAELHYLQDYILELQNADID